MNSQPEIGTRGPMYQTETINNFLLASNKSLKRKIKSIKTHNLQPLHSQILPVIPSFDLIFSTASIDDLIKISYSENSSNAYLRQGSSVLRNRTDSWEYSLIFSCLYESLREVALFNSVNRRWKS